MIVPVQCNHDLRNSTLGPEKRSMCPCQYTAFFSCQFITNLCDGLLCLSLYQSPHFGMLSLPWSSQYLCLWASHPPKALPLLEKFPELRLKGRASPGKRLRARERGSKRIGHCEAGGSVLHLRSQG